MTTTTPHPLLSNDQTTQQEREKREPSVDYVISKSDNVTTTTITSTTIGCDVTNTGNGSGGGGGGGGGGGSDLKDHIIDDDHNDDIPGEATLLVSEFPPPPYYYSFYHYNNNGNNESNQNNNINNKSSPQQLLPYNKSSTKVLKPPEIPFDALARGTRRAAIAAARARAEAERIRLMEAGLINDIDKTDVILGGTSTTAAIDDDDHIGVGTTVDNTNNTNSGVVAVFGEVVEDPTLVTPLDPCEDPKIVREEVKRLNRQVVRDFVSLVQDLVHNPVENKKTRDRLSHNIFLMLQECNKFREHQARELLIQLLEQQLQKRKELIRQLQDCIKQADQELYGTLSS